MSYAHCALAVLSVIAWQLLSLRLSPILGLNKPNFRNHVVPASYGLALLGYLLFILWIFAYTNPGFRDVVLTALVSAAAMAILGLIDDIFGSRKTGGFRGHFELLIKQGRLTTGAAKAIGGALAGLWAGYALFPGDYLSWFLTALIVPLGANTLNLLDLRPGRAIGVAIIVLIAFAALTWDCASWLSLAIVAVLIPFAIWDGRGLAMMGDSGSNQLGALLGVIIAARSGVIVQITAVLVMLIMQIYSEKRSISGLIENNRALSKIDRMLGVR